MPYIFEDAKAPSGAPLLRVRTSGRISLEDAEDLGRRVTQGGRVDRLILIFMEKGTEWSPEARKYFPNMANTFRRCAAVVTNPIVRSAINLMVRLIGESGVFRIFADEGAALAWLDEPSV